MNEYNLARMNTSKMTKNNETENNKSNFLGEQNSRLLMEEQKNRSKLEA